MAYNTAATARTSLACFDKLEYSCSNFESVSLHLSGVKTSQAIMKRCLIEAGKAATARTSLACFDKLEYFLS